MLIQGFSPLAGKGIWADAGDKSPAQGIPCSGRGSPAGLFELRQGFSPKSSVGDGGCTQFPTAHTCAVIAPGTWRFFDKFRGLVR